jgi:ribosomal protein RSM22 (predicted rRNA methylase)
MGPELPGALRAAADALLEGVSRRDLAERSARVSTTYRAGGVSASAIGGAADATAYVLSRLPATYAAASAALEEARRLAPDFSPTSLLDAGAGPGGASWAALEAWPQIATVTLLDASAPFLDMASTLARSGPDPLRTANLRRGDLTGSSADWPCADLVVSSYALAEIAPALQDQVVRNLWAACAGLMVLVEPGTPAGFGRILAARQALIAAGAAVVAPCPHSGPCPIEAPRWCHFAQRLPRSRDHRLIKGADAPFEDEKFIYLAVARPDIALGPRTPRVMGPPRTGKPGVAFEVCTPGGLERRSVGKRDKPAFAAVRHLRWGQAWPAS